MSDTKFKWSSEGDLYISATIKISRADLLEALASDDGIRFCLPTLAAGRLSQKIIGVTPQMVQDISELRKESVRSVSADSIVGELLRELEDAQSVKVRAVILRVGGT